MSKLNINKTEWLELVFEGKNKAYGAYQLRREDGNTSAKAFFSGMALLAGIASLPIILSSFTDKPVETGDKPLITPLVVTKVVLPKKEIQKEIERQIQKADIIAPKTQNLINPNIVQAVDAPETDFTKPEDVGKKISDNPMALNGSVTGDPRGTTTEPTPPAPVETPSVPEGPVSPAILEKSPMFPGGLDAFLKIVSNRFQTPEMEESSVVKIIVFFVVEPDGSITDIKVPRSPGFGLDKEAIRVLKSIKTKWEPGIYQGQAVRTQYSLPITVQVN